MTAVPTLAQVLALPSPLRRAVPPEFGDPNGHMNVRYHLALHDDACWAYHDGLGFTEEHVNVGRRGLFAREHHLSYLSEVLIGDDVSVHVRLLNRSARTIHLVQYLVDHRSGAIASIHEQLSVHVDLDARTAAPFDRPGPVDALDLQLQADLGREWTVATHLGGGRVRSRA